MACLGKHRKQRARQRILEDFVFGVPLHADDEPGLGQAHRFNLPVGGNRFDAERRAGTIDPLRVQRIHHHFSCAGE